jgi:parvulin-like peptidyl-prolyl isomerase
MKDNEKQIQQRIDELEKKLQMGSFDAAIFNERGLDFKRRYLEQILKYEEEHDEEYASEEGLVDMRAELRARLDLPDESELDDNQLTEKLHKMIDVLAQFHICLEFTDHLSDRELYNLLLNDLLKEGFHISGSGVNVMENIDASWNDPEAFERYYAIGDTPLKVRREEWLKAKAESYRKQPRPKLLSKQ